MVSTAKMKYINIDTALAECFARAIRQRRKSLGVTQQELADICGLTVTTVHRIETAEEKRPTLGPIAKMCLALDLDCQQIIYDAWSLC